MGTSLGPKYIPHTYMDPLGKTLNHADHGCKAGTRSAGLGFRV